MTAFPFDCAGSLGVATIAQAAVAGLAPKVRESLRLYSDRDIFCANQFG